MLMPEPLYTVKTYYGNFWMIIHKIWFTIIELTQYNVGMTSLSGILMHKVKITMTVSFSIELWSVCVHLYPGGISLLTLIQLGCSPNRILGLKHSCQRWRCWVQLKKRSQTKSKFSINCLENESLISSWRKFLSIQLGRNSWTFKGKRYVSTTESPCE